MLGNYCGRGVGAACECSRHGRYCDNQESARIAYLFCGSVGYLRIYRSGNLRFKSERGQNARRVFAHVVFIRSGRLAFFNCGRLYTHSVFEHSGSGCRIGRSTRYSVFTEYRAGYAGYDRAGIGGFNGHRGYLDKGCCRRKTVKRDSGDCACDRKPRYCAGTAVFHCGDLCGTCLQRQFDAPASRIFKSHYYRAHRSLYLDDAALPYRRRGFAEKSA